METNSVLTDTRPEGMIFIECPGCGYQRHVKIEKVADSPDEAHPIMICKCGYIDRAIVEKRKYKRHAIKATGSILLEKEKGRHEYIPIIVKDLSRSGVKFATATRYLLRAAGVTIVSLNFNGNPNMYFLKEATIRKIRGKLVSAEFTSPCGKIEMIANQTS